MAGATPHDDARATGSGAARLPEWLRRPIAHGGEVRATERLLRELSLPTVCQSAKCPNRGECFGEGTATFLVLGAACTRACGFCAVEAGRPAPPDPSEPARVAEAARRMGLRHIVVTMVTRDDLPDGGAAHVAETVRAVRGIAPGAAVEVLVSDFAGAPGSAETVAAARPDVFNHNVETVPRLYGRVRPEADYGRSLSVLARAREVSDGALPTKSGLMLGLGETRDEVEGVMRDLRDVGVSLLTLGQYLRPSADHLPVMRFVPPQEFVELARVATEVGFRFVASAPYVRSSYRASDLARSEGVGVPAHLSSAHLR